MTGPADTYPSSIPQRERVVNPATHVTGLTGWIPAVHHRQMAPIPGRLVLQLPPKLSQCSIENRFAQLGSRKSFRVQVLDANSLVVTDKLRRMLVYEILP